jgi:multidrug resistance efflux pump
MTLVLAPVPGVVSRVSVRARDIVEQGQVLFELEVLEMAQHIVAPVDGSVRLLFVQSGDAVRRGALLAEIDDYDAECSEISYLHDLTHVRNAGILPNLAADRGGRDGVKSTKHFTC